MHRARRVGFINFIFLKKDATIAPETSVLLTKITSGKSNKSHLRTHLIKLHHLMTLSANDGRPKAWNASKNWILCGRNQ